jgi:RimJ/RimL family protein N-acetyltransferase
MDRQPVLETGRLTLRPLAQGDFDSLFAIASDREIWAMHPAHDRWQEPVFRDFFDHGMVQGGALAIIDKATERVIGSSRFGVPEPDRPDEIEIGWSFLSRDFWGRGYNAEFKRAMLAHALAHYRRVTFQVGEDNRISRKAMENIGGVLTDETAVIERSGTLVNHVFYEITRESFAAGPLID